uniref:hypothetical protein n=1 Tax=Tessaracoccus timonensis TaxID=2161816 RepID=UPI000D5619C7|nr:hypothetical protein [Tessaracoccus timonensis]
MLSWGDGLRVNPGILQARAASLNQVKGQLDSKISEHESIDMGPWRGDAQRAQHSSHRKLLTDLRSHARRIPPAANALSNASQSFTQIQQSQHNLINRARAWDYEIQNNGVLRDLNSGLSKIDPRRLYQRVRIQGSVLSLVVRLNATDFALAARLKIADIGNNILDEFAEARDGLIDLLHAGGDKLLSGLEWLGGKIKDGLDWGKGKIEDAWEWGKGVFDNVMERLGHTAPAIQRLFETLGTQPQWLRDFFEKGEIPQLAEVAGSALFLGGQIVGIPFNFITNEDQHFFDDGRPWMATPADVQDHVVEKQRFDSVNDVIDPMMDVYNTQDSNDPTDRAQIQVTPVVGDDGQVRYVVSIPGTTESMTTLDGWNGNPSGTDWAANLKGVGYGSTAATESIMNSIDQAIQEDQARRGISGGKPEVLLSGHSQGGIIAGNIAASNEFADKYDVGGVISAGSPVETLGVPEHIPVYNYQNALDPVPRTDLGGARWKPGEGIQFDTPSNVHNVVFPHEGSISPGHTHLQQTYADNIADLQERKNNPYLSNNPNVQAQQAMDRDLGRFYNGEVDNAYRVEYGRETN